MLAGEESAATFPVVEARWRNDSVGCCWPHADGLFDADRPKARARSFREDGDL